MGKTGNSPRRIQSRSYTVDENGEVVHYEETTQFVGSADGYVKIFESGWKVKGLEDVSFGLVMDIVRRMTFADEGQIVEINPADKERMARSMGWSSVRQVERMVRKLVDAGVLRKKRRSYYQVNPFMFGRGRQGDIDALRSAYMTERIRDASDGGNGGSV